MKHLIPVALCTFTVAAFAGWWLHGTLQASRAVQAQPGGEYAETLEALPASQSLAITDLHYMSALSTPAKPDMSQQKDAHYDTPIADLDLPGGLFTTFPQRPDRLYLQYYESASQGNPAAQYQLAMALRQCLNVPDQSRVNALIKQHNFDQPLIDKLSSDARYCSGLFELLPEDTLKNSYLHWYEQALNGGDVLAMALHWFEYPESFSQEQAEVIVQKAIETKAVEAFVFASSYMQYYFPHDDTLSETWNYMACVYSAACDPVQLVVNYPDYYTYADSQLIVDRAKQWLALLEEGKLELHP